MTRVLLLLLLLYTLSLHILLLTYFSPLSIINICKPKCWCRCATCVNFMPGSSVRAKWEKRVGEVVE